MTSAPTMLDALRAGEQPAVEAFVARHRPPGLRLAEALLGDRALAEDQVQEAFVVALSRIDQVRSPSALGAWFRQIVRSRCHRVLRRIRPTPTAPERLDGVDAQLDPEQTARRAQAAGAVRAAVAALPAIGRREAEMYYFEDRSQAEIASELGVPTGTIKRRLHTARRRLRDMLIGELPADGVEADGLPF